MYTSQSGNNTESTSGELTVSSPGVSTNTQDQQMPSERAPIELIANFLSSIMMRNYETALEQCTSILSYEPHHEIASQFYPLILMRLELSSSDEDSSETTSNVTADSMDYADFTDMLDDTDEVDSDSSSTESESSSSNYYSADDSGSDHCFHDVELTPVSNNHGLQNVELTPVSNNHGLQNVELTPVSNNHGLQNVELTPVSNNHGLRDMELTPAIGNQGLRDLERNLVIGNHGLRNIEKTPVINNHGLRNVEKTPVIGMGGFRGAKLTPTITKSDDGKGASTSTHKSRGDVVGAAPVVIKHRIVDPQTASTSKNRPVGRKENTEGGRPTVKPSKVSKPLTATRAVTRTSAEPNKRQTIQQLRAKVVVPRPKLI